MKLFSALLVCALSIQVNLSAQSLPDQAKNSPIQIFITASHKNGSAVSLAASDIEISVDKKPVEIKDVRPAKSEPLLFALVVDVSHSDAEQAKGIRKASAELFQALSSAGNRGYLTLFNHEVGMTPSPITAEKAGQNLEKVNFQGATALYDAIDQSADKLSSGQNAAMRRRVIVVVSDGEDNMSRMSAREVVPMVQRDAVEVFSLLIPSPHSGPLGPRVDGIKSITRESGGKLVEAEVINSVPLLLAAIDGQSAVSFVPPQALGPKLHSLQVRSRLKDVQILAPAQISLP